MTIWTIGHSNRPWADFLRCLTNHRIKSIADVRRFPASKRYPHFKGETMAVELAKAGIGYQHFPDLGGRRDPRPDSPNTAWRAAAFRGYADYMMEAPFDTAMKRLLEAVEAAPLAVMCAEALWWQCHRSLIADYLKAAGHSVLHIMGPEKAEEHPYTSAARIVDGQLSYSGLVPAS